MKYLILLTISSALAALDQASKLYIHSHFKLGESVEIIPPIFNFTYVRNSGGAFGIFQETNDAVQTILFLIFPIIAFILIFNILKKLKNKDLLQITALSFIFGGAIGNFIDRVHLRYVIDFLDFHTPDKSWIFPTFNIADTCIVLGICVVAFLAYFHPKKMPI